MKVLRLANSAYYKRRESVKTVHEAALVLGTKNLSEVLLMLFAAKLLILLKNMNFYLSTK
ncbi:MAG: HDOD domain-containing protein [Desulfobacterales bacterium]|nr:HDOD domain-containing protein [Desulfobacterales bacterium]MCP4163923.1 HDOD domain-containing protein [Deltaproteobacteria bacterium]